MAKAETKPAEGAEAAPAPAPKKSKKLLIIAAAAALAVILIGGAAFFLLAKNSSHGAEGEDVTAEADKPKKKSGKEDQPIYVQFEPFTVNLVPEQGDQYLQVSISIDLDDASAQEKVKLYMPKLRNDVMLDLASKKPSELANKEGKEQLAAELRDKMNRILNPDSKAARGPSGPIKEVLFTSFIIQ